MSKQTGIIRKAVDISKDATVATVDPAFTVQPACPSKTVDSTGKKTKPVCKKCWFTGQFVNDKTSWLCKDSGNNDVIHAPAPVDMTAQFEGTHATNADWFNEVIGTMKTMKLKDEKKAIRELKPIFTTVQQLTDNGIVSVYHCKYCPVRKCKFLPGFTHTGIRAWYHVPLETEILVLEDLVAPALLRKAFENRKNNQQARDTARAAGVEHIEQLVQQASAETDDDVMDLDDEQEFPDLSIVEEKQAIIEPAEVPKATFAETLSTVTIPTTKPAKHFRKNIKNQRQNQESSGSVTLQEYSIKDPAISSATIQDLSIKPEEIKPEEKKIVLATDFKATALEVKLKMPADFTEMMELTNAIKVIEKYVTGKLIWNTASPATVQVKIVNPIPEKKTNVLSSGFKKSQSWADD